MDPDGAGMEPEGAKPEPRPDENQSQKTAGKPHRITIVLAVTAMVLTAITIILTTFAVYFSFRALRTSEIALAKGQRAYLSVQNYEVAESPDNVGITANVVNVGNTPANDITFEEVVTRKKDDREERINNITKPAFDLVPKLWKGSAIWFLCGPACFEI